MSARISGRYWFAPPDWGFGPYPVTALGWFVSSISLFAFFAIVIAAIRIKNAGADPSWLWLLVLAVAPLEIYISTRLVRFKTDPVNRISDYRTARSRA